MHPILGCYGEFYKNQQIGDGIQVYIVDTQYPEVISYKQKSHYRNVLIAPARLGNTCAPRAPKQPIRQKANDCAVQSKPTVAPSPTSLQHHRSSLEHIPSLPRLTSVRPVTGAATARPSVARRACDQNQQASPLI